jgi:hypothetical protein
MFLLGLSLGISVLHRPLLGVMLLGINLVVLLYVQRQRLLMLVLLNAGFGLALIPWVVRNYIATNGEIVLLEKFYYDNPMTYGKGYIEFRRWVGTFGSPGDLQTDRLYATAIEADSPAAWQRYRNDFIGALPQWVKASNSTDSIAAALDMMYAGAQIKDSLYPEGSKDWFRLQSLYPMENNIQQRFVAMEAELKAKQPLKCMLVNPLRIIARNAIVSSHSYGWGFLEHLPRVPKMLLKVAFLGFNLLLWGSFLAFLFIRNYRSLKLLTVVCLAFTLFYTVFYFKYFESRYIITVYPLMILCATLFYHHLFFGRKKAGRTETAQPVPAT